MTRARSHLTSNAATALELFHLGWGTDRIAEYWKISEAEALRRLNVERSIKLHRSAPYEPKPEAPQHSNRILVVQGVRGACA